MSDYKFELDPKAEVRTVSVANLDPDLVKALQASHENYVANDGAGAVKVTVPEAAAEGLERDIRRTAAALRIGSKVRKVDAGKGNTTVLFTGKPKSRRLA